MAKSKSPSYTAKIRFIRQFDTVKSGRLTPGLKRSITVRYNKYKKLSGLQFVKADKSTIDKIHRVGGYTTSKGFFIGSNDDRLSIDKKGRLRGDMKSRITFTVLMTKSQITRFIDDPVGYIENVVMVENAELFKQYKYPKYRFWIRLMFKWGAGTMDFTLERLEYYLTRMADTVDSRTGKIKTKATVKKREMAKAMIGIKLMFYRRPNARTNNNAKKQKTKGSHR